MCAGGVKGARGRSGHSYLFPEFSSDVAKPLGAIKAHGLQTSIPQHFNHLSIFWKTPESRGWLIRGHKLSTMSLKSEIRTFLAAEVSVLPTVQAGTKTPCGRPALKTLQHVK